MRILIILLATLLLGCNESGQSKPSYSNIAVFGDSLTSGDSIGGNYVEPLSRILGIPVYKYGRGGEPLISAQGRFESVLRTRPNLIIVMEGTNDAAGGIDANRAANALHRMVLTAKANGVQIAVCSIPPFTKNAAGINGAAIRLNSAIQNVAKYNGVKFIDVYRAFNNDPSLFQKDGVHLNREGNLRVATAITNGL